MAGEFRLTLLGCQPVGACGSDCASAGNLVWTGDILEGANLLTHGFLPCADQYIGGLARGAAGPARTNALAPGNARASGRFVRRWPLSRALLFSARENRARLCHARLLL